MSRLKSREKRATESKTTMSHHKQTKQNQIGPNEAQQSEIQSESQIRKQTPTNQIQIQVNPKIQTLSNPKQLQKRSNCFSASIKHLAPPKGRLCLATTS